MRSSTFNVANSFLPLRRGDELVTYVLVKSFWFSGRLQTIFSKIKLGRYVFNLFTMLCDDLFGAGVECMLITREITGSIFRTVHTFCVHEHIGFLLALRVFYVYNIYIKST
jgi:hypothetical protein